MVRLSDYCFRACLALLQGHTALVCQVQLFHNTLVTGGSDGRVIIFTMNPTPPSTSTAAPPPLSAAPSTSSDIGITASPLLQQVVRPRSNTSTPFEPRPFSSVQRLAAHDSSVTGLQFDSRFLVTGGNDGRVRLFEFRRDGAGGGKFEYVREMSDPCESVWKVAYTEQTCAIMCKRAGKTQVEIWSFRPTDVRD